MLSPVQRRPGNSSGILALEEQTLALAILESEDLAIAADVELALQITDFVSDQAHMIPSIADRERGK